MRRFISKLNSEWFLFFFGLIVIFYWQSVTPIQYEGDSDSYLGIAHLILSKPVNGVPMIFRSPGYPLFLAFTGMVIPGTFKIILLIQALLGAVVPLLIYRIILPYGSRLAFVAGLIAIMSGTLTVHTAQVLTESLFTALLFLSLLMAVELIRFPFSVKEKWYGLPIVFFALNMVRPFAGPIFWLIFIVLCWVWWRADVFLFAWKKILAMAVLFIGLTILWVIADDITFSVGARYSPLNVGRVGADNKLITYLYDLPFNEAYFEPWARRIKNFNIDENIFNSLSDRAAMKKVRDIAYVHLKAHPEEVVELSKQYSYHLFAQFSGQLDELARYMFAQPNYVYANYIRTILETDVSKDTRLKLFYSVAKEAHRNWPMRWIEIFRRAPLSIFLGPEHINGIQQYLLAFSPLRYYKYSENLAEKNNLPSLVKGENGPATRFMLATLIKALHTNPELWYPMKNDPLYVAYIKNNNPENQIHAMLTNPNQNYAWFTLTELWNLMGYDAAAELLRKVAKETYLQNLQPLILRIWETTLMVMAGPPAAQFDHVWSTFGRAEIYRSVATAQLNDRQIRELRATETRYAPRYLSWQAPVQIGYSCFYFIKPFFLISSLLGIAIWWMRKQSIVIPLILMIPYMFSLVVYGMLFTGLPRYTDPILLLPVIVTFLGLANIKFVTRE